MCRLPHNSPPAAHPDPQRRPRLGRPDARDWTRQPTWPGQSGPRRQLARGALLQRIHLIDTIGVGAIPATRYGDCSSALNGRQLGDFDIA